MNSHHAEDGRNAGASFVALALLLMGVVTLAACAVFPAWKHCIILRDARARESRRISTMRASIEHDRYILQAIRSDPAVLARLAQRDLGLVAQGTKAVRVAAVAADATPVDSVFDPAVTLDEPMSDAPRAPGRFYRMAASIAESECRNVLVVMSVVLMCVGLWLPRGDKTRRITR